MMYQIVRNTYKSFHLSLPELHSGSTAIGPTIDERSAPLSLGTLFQQ